MNCEEVEGEERSRYGKVREGKCVGVEEEVKSISFFGNSTAIAVLLFFFVFCFKPQAAYLGLHCIELSYKSRYCTPASGRCKKFLEKKKSRPQNA